MVQAPERRPNLPATPSASHPSLTVPGVRPSSPEPGDSDRPANAGGSIIKYRDSAVCVERFGFLPSAIGISLTVHCHRGSTWHVAPVHCFSHAVFLAALTIRRRCPGKGLGRQRCSACTASLALAHEPRCARRH